MCCLTESSQLPLCDIKSCTGRSNNLLNCTAGSRRGRVQCQASWIQSQHFVIRYCLQRPAAGCQAHYLHWCFHWMLTSPAVSEKQHNQQCQQSWASLLKDHWQWGQTKANVTEPWRTYGLVASAGKYSWPMNNVGMNWAGPLIQEHFSIVNTVVLHSLRLVESVDAKNRGYWSYMWTNLSVVQGSTLVINTLYILKYLCVFYSSRLSI